MMDNYSIKPNYNYPYLKIVEGNKPLSDKINYPFVDWIRMIAMIGIIWAHTPNFKDAENFRFIDNIPAYFFFMDFLKFGVICFFLISGFLLAQQLPDDNPKYYLKRRLISTLPAYIIAFTGIVLFFIIKTRLLHIPSSYTIVQYTKMMFFISALWFLPNYLVSLFIILIFRRFLNSWVFGAFLLLVTLIYSYYFVYSAYSKSHVYALFAYIFYLWLGYTVARLKLQEHFKRYNIYVLAGFFILLYVCSSIESIMLYHLGSQEPMNILRLSNQLYSIAAFITMIKLFQKPISKTLINPRKETYGLYLYHMFPIAFLTYVINKLTPLGLNTFNNHIAAFIGWFIFKFIVIYSLTLLIVKFLRRYNLGYLN